MALKFAEESFSGIIANSGLGNLDDLLCPVDLKFVI
jgi:hypothetical protein